MIEDEITHAPGTTGNTEIRPPAYTEQDFTNARVKCYRCNNFTGNTWIQLMDHSIKDHGLKQKDISGTYMQKMVGQEQKELERANYKKRNRCVGKTRPSGEKPKIQQGMHNCEDSLLYPQNCIHPNKKHFSAHLSNKWVLLPTWVQVGADGTPIEPLQCSLEEPIQHSPMPG